jgi:hypothetical protein
MNFTKRLTDTKIYLSGWKIKAKTKSKFLTPIWAAGGKSDSQNFEKLDHEKVIHYESKTSCLPHELSQNCILFNAFCNKMMS